MNHITGSSEDDRKPQFKFLTSASRLYAIYIYIRIQWGQQVFREHLT